jgi:adenine-specific DNA glycosylase
VSLLGGARRVAGDAAVSGARERALLEWYRAVARRLPWRATRDPYGLLVSEVMLQQTQAARVVPYW